MSLPRTAARARLCARVALSTTLVAVIAGCSAGGNGSGAAPAPTSAGAAPTSAAVPTPTKDDALAAKVPQKVAADGKIVFAADASYAPNEFYAPDNNTTVIGMDVDLGTAVAQKLGLTAEFQNSNFDGIIPGIASGKFELGMSSFSVTPERLQTVDMVSYFTAGTSMAVKSGNPDNLSVDDLCGKAVAAESGTTQVDDLNARNQKCTAAGKPAIQISQLQAQTDVNLALTANRVVAMLADSPVVDYAVKTTDGAIQTVGQPYDTAPYGIVLAKGQDQFPDAVRGALQALIDDGTYKAILTKWNISDGAIPTAQVDPDQLTMAASTDDTTASRTGAGPEPIAAVPVRHPGRWVAVVVLAVLAAMFVHTVLTNRGFRWDVVGRYLFSPPVLNGLRNTLILTVLAMLVGIVGGVGLAVMRLSPNPVLSGVAGVYIWLFRGTPQIAQLLFWNFLAALYPRLSLGIPFGPALVSFDTNDLINQFTACLLGLGLNEAAYMAEIVRGGLQSVEHGQTEAAGALGMSRTQTLRRIVLPQAMRVIIPPTGNETISMLKTTSLVVVIGYFELLTSVQRIYSTNFQTIPLLIVAALWYLALTSALSVGQGFVERRYGRGVQRGSPGLRLFTRRAEGGARA